MSPTSSSLAFLLALCACALLGQCLGATTDQQCLDACSDYSISIGHCRDVYGNEREWRWRLDFDTLPPQLLPIPVL
jgi:hypothetical protein